MRRLVDRLQWKPQRSTWSEYTKEHSYDEDDLRRKSNFVRRVLAPRRWSLVWDIGCNTGTFSRLAAEHAEYVLALDADHLAVDRMYDALKREGNDTILPLLADVADPSPGLGWRGLERNTLSERGAPDLILCLALIHHVVIGRNIPIADFVEWLAGFGADVIVEFVGHGDPMVDKLLRNRTGQDIEYSAEALELALARHFMSVTHESLKRFSNRPCTTWGGRGTSARTDAGGPMRAYSMDLRERALLDSDAGMKAADVAAKYRVSGSWVRLLKQRRRDTGEVAPRVQRHGRRGMLEPHLHTLAALIAAQPDRTLAELKDALATPASVPTVWRAVRALGLTVKKNGSPVRTRSA